MTAASKTNLIGTLVGKYQITRELGSGGFGVVYEVVQPTIGHRAAVKLLNRALAKDPRHKQYVDRFVDEARAVNLINHPGVLKIFDLGELGDGTMYILMELLEGQALAAKQSALRAANKRMSHRQSFVLFGQLAGALSQAHEKGIIHRDIKPDNIFLIRDADVEGGERSKLLDFGLAKFLDSPERRTTAGITLGTPSYMSPEQCMGADQIDGKSDVYALGILMYELLSGTLPFVGEPGKVMRAHVNETPPSLTDRAPGLPEKVTSLVNSMIRKEPSQRPGMREVESQIDSLLERGELGRADVAGAQGATGTGGGPQHVATVAVQALPRKKASPLKALMTPRNRLIGLGVGALLLMGLVFVIGRSTVAAPACPACPEPPKVEPQTCPAPPDCPTAPVQPSTPKPKIKKGKGGAKSR